MPGLDASRICLIAGAAVRGSGYRVSRLEVLSAWHIVAGAERVQLRFDSGPGRGRAWSAAVVECTRIDSSDLALLRFDPPEASEVTPVRYGLLGDVPRRIEVHTAGFPRWKVRRDDDPPALFRELHHAYGTASLLSNRRTGTLEVQVEPPGADPDRGVSPWAGMSGAAVWARDRIVGVVSEHHRIEGLGRLTAVRLDRVAGLPFTLDEIEVEPIASGSIQINLAKESMQLNVQHGTINLFQAEGEGGR